MAAEFLGVEKTSEGKYYFKIRDKNTQEVSSNTGPRKTLVSPDATQVQIKAALAQFLTRLKGAGKIDGADIAKNLDAWASKAYNQIQKEKKGTRPAPKQAKVG